MPTLTLTCTCGKKFKRHHSKVRPGGSYFCSKECRRSLTERDDGTFRCGRCGEWLPADAFQWWNDPRYTSGKRRDSYCSSCKEEYRQEYNRRPESQAKARKRHAEWRERCVQAGGDKALRWWFTRQMGGYRRRARKRSLGFDLDTDFLLELFHLQEGRCYYTNVELEWESFGKGTASPNSMTVDRRDPSRGYVRDNVVLCTYLCNTMKSDLQEQDFYSLCQAVLATRGGRSE